MHSIPRVNSMRRVLKAKGLADAPVADYYGPPLPGQSWMQYESFMKTPIVSMSAGVIAGALVAGPVGALVGGISGWLLSSNSSLHSNKPTTQGG